MMELVKQENVLTEWIGQVHRKGWPEDPDTEKSLLEYLETAATDVSAGECGSAAFPPQFSTN